MLTKRMMETPLPEPPMVENPLPEPPMMEPDRTSAKRRRRARYTPLPGIMEHAVLLAPNVHGEPFCPVRFGTDDGPRDGFW